MKHFYILARYSTIQILNIFTRDRQRVLFWIILIALPFIFAGSVSSGITIFKNISKSIPLNPMLNFFAFAIFILFGFSASTNLFVTVKSVFNSSYSERLAPLPVNMTALFASKIFEMIFYNNIDLAFCMPVFFGLTYMLGASGTRFIAAAAVFFLFEIFICFIVLSIALIMARFFNKRTADFIAWFIGVFFVISFIILQNYPSKLFKMSPGDIQSTLKIFESRYFEYLPTKWMINVIYCLTSGEYSFALLNFLFLSLLTILTGAASAIMFKLFFKRGLETQNEKNAGPISAGGTFTASYKRNSSFFAIVKKEFYCLFRNTQIVYSLLMMPAIFFIFTYLGFSFGNMGAFTFLLFTSYITSINSTMFCFGVEGPAINIYKSLPINADIIFRAKYSVYAAVNTAAASICFAFAVKFTAIPVSINIPLLYTAFIFGILWINLFICDFGFFFASYKGGEKLKNAVKMEGTFALMGIVFAVCASFVIALYKSNFIILYFTVFFLLMIQALFHYFALKKYYKGDF